MAVYSVFEPPERGRDAVEQAVDFKFVRDGFSFAAFFFGPIWMLWNGLWLVLVGYIGVAVVVAAMFRLFGVGAGTQIWSWLLLAILVGYEAVSLRRVTLLQNGWKDRGIVIADDLEAAERRFFSAWSPSARDLPPPPPLHSPMKLQSASAGDVIGLFPKPGANR
jgi:hypothetical protein